MDIKYLGHSAFEIETTGKKILIDPFLVCVPNYKPENIYDILNLKHEQVKYLGFDIDKLLDLGCIRIGNNKLSKEVYLHMNLRKKLCNKIINIFEECLIHYDYILIEFLNLEEEISFNWYHIGFFTIYIISYINMKR